MTPAIAAAMRAVPQSRGNGNIAEMVTGALSSPVAGRTDHLPISVPSNAYVIPADVVSALGQGNTTAGVKVLQGALRSMAAPVLAQSGTSPAAGKVDIMAAGGEFVVPPQVVAALGRGDLKAGHAVLDSFVRQVRTQNIKALRKMPGPKR